MAHNEHQGMSFTTKLLIGGLVGTAIGVLMAPREGSKTRTDLMEQSGRWRQRTGELASTVGSRVGPMIDRMRERAASTAERARETTERTAREAGEAMQERRARTYAGQERRQARGTSNAWFLIGALVGGFIGLVLAPRPGRETRQMLMQQSERLRHRTGEMVSDVRERVGPAMENVRERVGPAVENMRERTGQAMETVRERMAPAVENVRERMGRR